MELTVLQITAAYLCDTQYKKLILFTSKLHYIFGENNKNITTVRPAYSWPRTSKKQLHVKPT